MSSKIKPRSIASNLVFLFTPAAALLLFSAIGVFYWMVVRQAFAEDNAVLADKASALRAQLRDDGALQSLTAELQQTPRPGEHPTYWVRLLDAAGGVIVETRGMAAILPAASFPAPSDANATPKNYRADNKLFSLVALRARTPEKTCTIQLAQDRSADEEFTKEFGALAAAVLAAGVIAAIVIATTVAKRGLRPLADLTDSLERVGPTRLHERVPPARWPAELRPVVVAFDRMLDRLEESFTRLSQFSADLAHELRTPVANIRGEAEVALTRPRTPDEYRTVIESTVTECERLSATIDNLLFLARAEAADRHIERKRFQARAAVEKIAGYFQTLAEERGVTITCEGGGEVCGDETLFGRAVSNLIENALRFTPNDGQIRVSIDARGASTVVIVRDNGSGISREHLPHLFDRFYRVDPSRHAHGAGLGLALVKSIMDLHGGSARVDSESATGTTATLVFPSNETARA